MIHLQKEICYGCSACACICTRNCITMTADGEGFLYPVVDASQCIHCGACERVCPALLQGSGPKNDSSAVYAYSKDHDLRMKSSSGGIFGELAKGILEREGIVFGVSLQNGTRAYHHSVHTFEELSQLQGSKYLQSELGDSYVQAENFLKAGRTVLFSGTPCQIVGLKNYLGKTYTSLYTVAVACHGVPSPKLWAMRYREVGLPAEETSVVNFRHKFPDWRNYSLKFSNNGKTLTTIRSREDPYMQLYLHDYSLRPSCYQCKQKFPNIASDLVLCDYWGVELVHPELANEPGVSLVLINTSSGKELLGMVAHRMCVGETDLLRGLKGNPSLTDSAKIPKDRDAFFDNCETMTSKQLADKYLPRKSKLSKLLRKIKYIFSK